jgi:Gpi18-like mannosyltransferase
VKQSVSERGSDAFVLGLAVMFAGLIRYRLLTFESTDFLNHTSDWYESVQHLGFAAAGTAVSNYTPPYVYFLYLTSIAFPHLAPVAAIKVPSIVCDLLCAWFVYRIVRLRYPEGRAPLFSFIVVLLAPTVIANSAMWGQADSIYSAGLLACVYFLMAERPVLAVAAFGVALSIKFQAIFLAPALCALMLKRVVPPWTILLIPAIYAVAMVPAALVGRPVADLATVYFAQGDRYHRLTMNAPTLYAWLPERFYDVLVPAGLALMMAVGCLYVWKVWRSAVVIHADLILQLCLLSLLMTPFFLPKMHERFFYPADVLSIAYGFYFPKRYYVPVAVSFASLFAYQPFLFNQIVPPLPLKVLSLVMLVALAAVALGTRRDLEDACVPNAQG